MHHVSGQPALASILARAAIFSRFSGPRLAELARRSRRLKLGTGETLFQHGVRADALFMLLEGQLKLYRLSPTGQEAIVEVLEPLVTFGETCVLLEQPCFSLSCSALVESEVIAVDAQSFVAALADSVESCLLVMRRISACAERLVDEVDRVALQSGTRRVAGYLLGQLPPGRNEYVLRMSKGVLAARLSLRAETLSRILGQLANDGIVSVSSRNIVRVHSADRLRGLALETTAAPRYDKNSGRLRRSDHG